MMADCHCWMKYSCPEHTKPNSCCSWWTDCSSSVLMCPVWRALFLQQYADGSVRVSPQATARALYSSRSAASRCLGLFSACAAHAGPLWTQCSLYRYSRGPPTHSGSWYCSSGTPAETAESCRWRKQRNTWLMFSETSLFLLWLITVSAINMLCFCRAEPLFTKQMKEVFGSAFIFVFLSLFPVFITLNNCQSWYCLHLYFK